MSVMRCDKHDRHYDTDFVESCPVCEIELATAGRELFEEAIVEKVMDLFEWQGPRLQSFLIPINRNLGEKVFVAVGTREHIASLIQDRRQ